MKIKVVAVLKLVVLVMIRASEVAPDPSIREMAPEAVVVPSIVSVPPFVETSAKAPDPDPPLMLIPTD